jgi:hypothetical protein
MKKYILGSVVVAAALLVGCSSDGGECCGTGSGSLAGLGAETIPPKGPAALFKGDWITDRKEAAKGGGGFDADRNTQAAGSASTDDREVINFTFDCSDSYNQDDANITVENCAWDFSATALNCIDKNASVGKIVHLDYSCNNQILDGNLTVTLTVTDELNQTAESNATLNIKRVTTDDVAKITVQ